MCMSKRVREDTMRCVPGVRGFGSARAFFLACDIGFAFGRSFDKGGGVVGFRGAGGVGLGRGCTSSQMSMPFPIRKLISITIC